MVDRWKWGAALQNQEQKKIKRDGFLTFVKNIAKKYRKQLLDKGLDALKTVSKKTVHKAAETTGEFIGNKILKQKLVIDKNSRNIEKIIIPPENKRRRSIKCVKTSIIKVGQYKMSKLLNDSTLSKFVKKNGSK